VEDILQKVAPEPRRIFELGCGNGANAAYLTQRGYTVVGVDPSPDGVRIANTTHKQLQIDYGSTDDDLAGKYGQFPVVLSLEVVEHVFSPKLFAERVHDLLLPQGVAIISTPYHSYVKNVALALSGKLDNHFTALWEGGHIKFWSRRTLNTLFGRVGMNEIDFRRVGRVPSLAKSMICVYRRS
jgi:2-polyprenyl-6-hydroxyphenyl methylase/3-demethylubiquinone-9 3-methyltransferase